MTDTDFNFADTTRSTAVAAALEDLRRDVEKVLGHRPDIISEGQARLTVSLDMALAPETFVAEVGEDERIRIQGGDELGAVYGIYEVSHRLLGVDPFWFWKDLEPVPLDSLDLRPQRIACEPPAFRHRGWFINDEDLLGRWREPAGKRFQHWPGHPGDWSYQPGELEPSYEKRLVDYYTPVASAETMEPVFEALLRNRGNFIIPASFVDVMEPAEADLIRAAVRRGFYVSQHHVEPLGVSHFAYESWWGQQEKSPPFSYREDPEAMRACWKAYAEAWHELAGDRLIWQAGLRGRGDRALWDHDPEAKAQAGTLISRALTDQMKIIREVDTRPQPPATLTLWLEGAELLEQGQVEVPEGIEYVFSDHPLTQELREDFENLIREPGRSHGVYYHIAVWSMGPHLVQGPPPEKIARIVSRLVEKGDTGMAILNVANVREHLMGAACWCEQVWRPHPVDTPGFLSKWLPPEWVVFYEKFLDAIPRVETEWRLYDSGARSLVDRLIYARERCAPVQEYSKGLSDSRRDELRVKLENAMPRLDRLIEQTDRFEPEAGLRTFFDTNLRSQLRILRGLYGAMHALLPAPPDVEAALRSLVICVEGQKLGSPGKWKHWYRGDRKVGILRLMERLQQLQDDLR
ncbi:MAG: glycosyl hydrolase 115 family protein [Kiritimatiellia bacterium]